MNVAILSTNNKSQKNTEGSKSSNQDSKSKVKEVVKSAEDAINSANITHEEVTDMLSVEVKVTKEGTVITPREITNNSASMSPRNEEFPLISSHSAKAMNLQAAIAQVENNSLNQPKTLNSNE